jgi:hypothetical protein
VVGENESPQTLQCPNCGAWLPADVEEQYFCEFCGSPLPRAAGVAAEPSQPAEAVEAADWVDEEEVLPDWLAAVVEPAEPASEAAPRRIELRPASPPRARPEVPKSRSGVSCVLILGILMFLFALFLLGWVVLEIFRSRALFDAPSRQDTGMASILSQEPWHDTGGPVCEDWLVMRDHRHPPPAGWNGEVSAASRVGEVEPVGRVPPHGRPLATAPPG